MTALTVLKAARDLLTPEGSWTQGCFARGKRNIPVRLDSPAARSYCTMGALLRAGHGKHSDAALRRLCDVTGAPSISVWNDSGVRTHAEVISLLDRAIALELQRFR